MEGNANKDNALNNKVSKLCENTIKKMLFEMLLYEYRNLKFSYTSQQVIKSHFFYKYISYMKANRLIRDCANGHRKSFYKLDTMGRIQTQMYLRRTDTPERYAHLKGVLYADA